MSGAVPPVGVQARDGVATLVVVRYLAGLMLVVLTACGGSSSPSLSEAFCNDLHAGLTPFQIYADVKDQYSVEEFADLSYGWASISCKAELKSNAGLRSFLVSWDINPDV